MKNYTNYLQRTLLNDRTGELEPVTFKQVVSSVKIGRQGWRKMYPNNYDLLIFELKSDLEKILFMDIRNRFTKDRPEIMLNQSELARKYDTTPPTVNKFIRKLESVPFLYKVDKGIYRMNPYTYLPYHANAEELQKVWDSYFNQER